MRSSSFLIFLAGGMLLLSLPTPLFSILCDWLTVATKRKKHKFCSSRATLLYCWLIYSEREEAAQHFKPGMKRDAIRKGLARRFEEEEAFKYWPFSRRYRSPKTPNANTSPDFSLSSINHSRLAIVCRCSGCGHKLICQRSLKLAKKCECIN